MSDPVEDFYDYFEFFREESDPKEMIKIRGLILESFEKIDKHISNDYHVLGLVYYH